MWNRRLPSSTVASGQTLASRSLLPTSSLGRDSREIRTSSVRDPSSTRTPFLVRSLSPTAKLKGPNDMTSLVRAADIVIDEPSLRHLLTTSHKPKQAILRRLPNVQDNRRSAGGAMAGGGTPRATRDAFASPIQPGSSDFARRCGG